MTNGSQLRFKVAKGLLGTGLSVLLGIAGGALCGAAILVFGGLVGRSQTTGTEYLGYWNIAEVWLGFLYGGFFGAIVAPIGYVIAVRRIGFRRAMPPAFVGTLAGGCLGALVGPPVAALTGICGFFAGLRLVRTQDVMPASRLSERL